MVPKCRLYYLLWENVQDVNKHLDEPLCYRSKQSIRNITTELL